MTKKEQVQQATYTCSMHPEIHATKPGNCPKCGMKLIKEKAKTVKQSSNKKNDEMQMPPKEQPKKVDKMNNMSMQKEKPQTVKRIVNTKPPKTVRYELYVTDTLVNYAGKEKRAIAVNGQIPMPALTFTEGDTAEIVVHNQLKESTSLHWHGVFLPNKEDGV
ncbi:multicopper oxidase domain-containing protein, partial [Epilithonimonas hispanica]